jgi:hypothetical protein
MKQYKKIRNLELHETWIIRSGLLVRRVIGGLMYVSFEDSSESAIFVPTKDFKKIDCEF